MSAFHEALNDTNPGSHNGEFDAAQARIGTHMAIEVLYDHLEQISGLSAGSAPEDYLEPDDTQICRDAIAHAATLRRGDRWPGASDYDMTVRRSGRPAWTTAQGYSSSILLRPYLTRKVWEGQGYRIGNLIHDKGESLVILCTDGLLRCLRDPRVFRSSRAWGYGSLPDMFVGRNAIDATGLARNLARQISSNRQ